MKRKARRIEQKIQRVIEGVAMGMPITRACAAAGIPRSTFYNRLQHSSRLQQKLEQAEARIVELALSNVYRAIESGDLKVSLWLLERREPEYAPNSAVKARVKELEERPVDIEPEFVLGEPPFAIVGGGER